MNNQKNKNNLSDILQNKIKSGEIKMKPKIYFITKLVLLALATIIITFFALFVASFIFFTLRASGILHLPAFGFIGIKILFLSLPWLLILGLFALIVTSELFAKHFPFIYKRPFFYSSLAIILIIFVGGFLIDNSGFHTNMFIKAREGNLPVAGQIYKIYGAPDFKEMHYGIVSEVLEQNFKIETPRQEELSVSVGKNTRMPKEEIKENDAIMILGKKTDKTIAADEVKKVSRDFKIFPGKPPLMKIKNIK